LGPPGRGGEKGGGKEGMGEGREMKGRFKMAVGNQK